jgi:hypothetical protein
VATLSILPVLELLPQLRLLLGELSLHMREWGWCRADQGMQSRRSNLMLVLQAVKASAELCMIPQCRSSCTMEQATFLFTPLSQEQALVVTPSSP